MPLADVLVLTLKRGGTLDAWRRRGVVDRERLWFTNLTAAYPAIIILTHGDAADRQAFALLNPRPADAVIPEHEVDQALGPTANIGARVRRAIPERAASAVVQSVHLDDAAHAESAARELRFAGVRTALVARASHLPSRRWATHGRPHTIDAVEAGNRERRAVEAADLIVGVSDDIISDLCWRFAIDPARTRVIPNFVAVDAAAPVAPAADRDAGDIIAVGALDESQRHDILIDAVASLSDDLRESITLTIVGAGPLAQAHAARALQARVRLSLPGPLPFPVLQQRLAAATLLVHAAPCGPQPRPVLEAMALGTPVVTAQTSAPAGLLTNGVTGIAAPLLAEAFASAMVGLLSDPDWRDMLGQAASRVVRQHCSQDRVLDLTLAAHADALAPAHPAQSSTAPAA